MTQSHNNNIYTKKRMDFLVKKTLAKLTRDDDLCKVTATQLRGIFVADAAMKFLDSLIVDGRTVLQLGEEWFGPYSNEHKVREDFPNAEGLFDLVALRQLIVDVSCFETSNDDGVIETMSAKEIAATNTANMKRAKTAESNLMKAIGAAGSETLMRFGRVAKVQAKTDLLVDEPCFGHEGKTGIYKMPFKLVDPDQYWREDTQTQLDQYEEYFKDLRQLVNWICAVRFSSKNRADSFLHIQAPTGFGKSAFIDMFLQEDLGYGHKTKLELIKGGVNGATTGASAMAFAESSVLFLDETEKFAKELKDINRHMTITEKYKGQVEVEVYAKIMFSQEDPAFLRSVVGNAQTIRRFSSIDYTSDNRRYDQFLAEMGYSYEGQQTALRWLITSTMKDWLMSYRADREKCHQDASKVMDEFKREHGIQNTVAATNENPDIIGEQFLEFLYDLVDQEKFGKVRVRVADTGDYAGNLFCAGSDLNSLWTEFVATYDEGVRWAVRNSQKSTLGYAQVDLHTDNAFRINGKGARWKVFKNPAMLEELKTNLQVVGGMGFQSVKDRQKRKERDTDGIK